MVKNLFNRKSDKTKSKNGSKPRRQSSLRRIVGLAVLACVILLAISGYCWWTKIVMNPDRALKDTLAKNLRTRSITKSVDQSGATGGIKQTTFLTFFPVSIQSQTNTVLTQGIGSNATAVSTETIGTKTEDFVRYTDVKNGDNLQGVQNLKGLLGAWAKREQDLSKGQGVTFLSESLFGVMPFGYFDASQSSQLLDMISQKNIYKYTDVKKEIENKRPVYVYDMSINPADLVDVVRTYVQLSEAGDTSQLDPAQYKGLGDVKVKLTIDIFSRQVTKVEYSTGRVENYSGQNLYHPINLPDTTIPVEELQKRLQGQSV